MIGTKLGEVMDVDVLESGVNWGKFLQVRVQIDITKKLVRGKRNVIEGGEQRWITFKYERLPNFCYRYGLLSHKVKECKEGNGSDINTELNTSSMGPGCGVRNQGKMEENLQGLDRRKEGPVRVFQCANQRDAKRCQNIRQMKVGWWEMCLSQRCQS